jgi:23S rRNA (guanosine2251-2'-O)-methyltransferase
MQIPREDQLIIGVHAVTEVLRHAPEKIVQVFIEEGRREKKEEIIALCKKGSIPLRYVQKQFLDKSSNTTFHQSIGAQIKDRLFLDAKKFLKEEEEKNRSLVLMIDQIFDPQNFGSLLRCCECFGVSAIVWSKNRGVDLNPTVSKASCGASEFVPLIRVSNLAETVDQFKRASFSIVGAECNPQAKNAFSFTFPEKTLLIVGSEGEGIQMLIRKKLDHAIYIPCLGHISSLNVANATAVLLALYNR